MSIAVCGIGIVSAIGIGAGETLGVAEVLVSEPLELVTS